MEETIPTTSSPNIPLPLGPGHSSTTKEELLKESALLEKTITVCIEYKRILEDIFANVSLSALEPFRVHFESALGKFQVCAMNLYYFTLSPDYLINN